MKAIDIIRSQVEAYDAGRAHAMVTITGASGSAPRSSGRMLVFADGATVGTIGGGAVELLAAQDAVKCITSGESLARTYDLGAPSSDTGMTCGGTLSVFIEAFPTAPLLIMCGGGHVGSAVLKLASFVGFSTVLLDDRDTASFAGDSAGRFIRTSDYEADMRSLDVPPGAYIVIATHGHAFDSEALLGALSKKAAYIGMIGSSKKVAAVFDKLRAMGVSDGELSRVFAPVGLDLGGETPEEIALAVMAEILTVKYARTARHLKERGK